MIKRILKLSAVNTLSAGLNFLSTILIVKSFGLNILGEFTVFNATIALMLLAYIVLPPNYSVFKLQDDDSYMKYFNFNYLFITLLLLPVVYFVQSTGILEISGVLLFGYLVFLALQNYFDVLFQATNQLKIYFMALFFVALIRFFLLIFIYISDMQTYSIDLLIQIYLLPLVLVLLWLVYMQRGVIFKKSVASMREYFSYVKKYFYILSSYYFGTVVKRVKDNSLVLLFSAIVSTEIIGLYALFVKVGSVVLGQIRVLEALLMNRTNLKNMVFLKNTSAFIGLFAQLILMGIGLVYLKINTGSYYLFSIMLYSFIVYPYLKTIFARSKLLSEYNNNAINKSYLLYLLVIGLAFCIAFLFEIENVNYLIAITIFGEIFISKILSYQLRSSSV